MTKTFLCDKNTIWVTEKHYFSLISNFVGKVFEKFYIFMSFSRVFCNNFLRDFNYLEMSIIFCIVWNLHSIVFLAKTKTWVAFFANLECKRSKRKIKKIQKYKLIFLSISFNFHFIPINRFKGTQDWDFFWLRFWNLYYFFLSYVKILRLKNFFFWSGHYWGRYDFSA
jgi:hypothetical protein